MIELLVHEYKPERPEDARFRGMVRLEVRLTPVDHGRLGHSLVFHKFRCTEEQLATGLESLAAKIREDGAND